MLSGVSVTDGVLTVNGNAADNAITVSEVGDSLEVNVDGEVTVVDRAEVESLVIRGRRGDDLLENRTSLDAVIIGGRGDDVIRGGSGNDVMNGGAGDDVITDTGGDNVLRGGRGDDSLQTTSSGSDTLFGGAGDDVLYAIVGEANVVNSGRGNDQVIARLGLDETDASARDTTILFGTENLTVEDGVLYVMGGGRTVITQVGDQLVVSVDGERTTFDADEVTTIAGVGSGEDDVFINLTDKETVYYGVGGDDLLIGGSSRDLLKGGSGNDVILGRGGNDDLSGDTDADILFGGPGTDLLRFDADDVFVFGGLFDTLIES